MTEWIKCSERLPTEGGYYMTLHKRPDTDIYLFKAFWYSPYKKLWIFRYVPDVGYWWNKRFEFYVPCQMQDGLEPLKATW